MGNFSLSPTENKNQSFNKSNIYKETGKGIIDNVNNKFDNSNNISNFGNSKKSKKNTYLYGYRQKSNKKIKSNNNLKRTTKTKSQNKVLSNIQEYTSFLLPKSIIPKTNDENIKNANEEKRNNYMKKYKNDDKFYRYRKKSGTIISNNSHNSKGKKKKYATQIVYDKNKINEMINDNNSFNNNKNNKSIEKSSQFVLLNNSLNKNLFNTFQEVNTDKNKNYTIIGTQGNMINELRLNSINERNTTYNLTNSNNISDNYYLKLNNDNFNSSQNSTINYYNYNNTHTSFIYNKPQILLEQLNDYINEEEENNDNKPRINKNFKETSDISYKANIFFNNILDNSNYKYIGNLSSKNEKEGIGKIIYKNNIILLTSFNNNKINGPILMYDKYGNIYKGYIKDNEFNDYCILNFNFNKNMIKNKNNIKNYFDNEMLKYKNDILINTLYNYNNLFDFYLDLSDDNYNYYYMEGYILNNNMNDVGIIKWKNNSSYVGELKNGVKDGIGVFKWPDGSRYEGEFVQDRLEGWGEIYFLDGKIFRGEILDGLPHGYGEFIWNEENKYVGNYINGQKEGFGIYIMISENLRGFISYFGFWKNGKQDGYGIIIKNKKMNYVKYKEGKKIKNYTYEIFITEILPIIEQKYKAIFLCDCKSLRKIVNNIIYYY
jgi:hypothetical protein